MNKDDIINGLTKEIARLKEQTGRKYTYTPEEITAEEQQIIGDAYESGVMQVIEKWLKQRADKNNDLLIHTFNASTEQVCLYKLAILMFDDWIAFLQRCRTR